MVLLRASSGNDQAKWKTCIGTNKYEFGNQAFDYYSKWGSCANTCKLELGIKPCDGIPVVELIWQQAML